MHPEIPRLERGPFLALLDEAVVVARGIFRPIFLPVATAPALVSGLMALVQGTTMRKMFSVSQAEPDFGPFIGGMALAYLMFFVFFAVRALAGAAMVAGAGWHLRREPVSAGRVWRWAFRGRTLGTLFLGMVFVGLGWMCCVLPGIYLAIVFAVGIPVLFWEEISGYPALARSRQLVLYDPKRRLFSPGMGWVVLAWIATVVLTWGINTAIQLPLTIVQQISMMRHIMGQAQQQVAANPMSLLPPWFTAAQVVVTMISTLAQQLVALFSASLFTLLYLRLRGRKEGTDLKQALDALGAPE